MKLSRCLAIILSITFIMVSACETEKTDEGAKKEKGQVEGTVSLAYVEWSSELASTNVVRVVLENAGYEVDIIPVSAAAMWQATASGDVDGMVGAWLPTTHENYLKAVKGKVVNLGPNLEGTRIGLVVPTYVTIDSIPEVNKNADKFDNEIIGIDPGAGIMSTTEKMMEEYKTDNVTLVEGSGATMTAALAGAVKNKEWIVVTGWTPHWMFGRWDLKYLEDPKGVFGGKEYIATYVSKGLKEDKPVAYKILDNFYWTPEQMQEVMAMNQKKGTDPYENAKKWVSENQDTVNKWIPESVKKQENQ